MKDIFLLHKIMDKLPRFIFSNLRIVIDLLKCRHTYPIKQYFMLRKQNNQKVVSVPIKQINGKKVLARPNTKDFVNLFHVFKDQYHLPPKPLPKKPVIIDLGSYIGYTIIHLKNLYPESKIIGIEMNRDNYNLAKENIKNFNDCFLLNMAISTKCGYECYKADDLSDAYHIVSEKNDNNLVRIPSITIESLIERFKLESIDFLKMDIEGEEIKIFEENLEWMNYVKMLNIEVHGSIQQYTNLKNVIRNHGFDTEKGKQRMSILAINNKI